jgi:hypothetical protein
MLRTVSILLAVLGLLAPPSFAQTSSSRRATASSTPVPVATPVTKKPSFFQRLFGRRPKATPVPATPTPEPKVRTARATAAKPAPSRSTTRTTKPRSTSTTAKPAASKPADTEPTASTPPETAEPAAPKPAATKPTARKTASKPAATTKTSTPPAGTIDPEELDRQKYDTAKAKAMEDPEIQALKKKADEAVTDDEAIQAQRAYNKALFAKMRKLDPLIKERIDRMEAAMMKRIGDRP